jgi:hypothetical protein
MSRESQILMGARFSAAFASAAGRPCPQQTGGSMYTDPRSQQRNSKFVLYFARFLRPRSSKITISRKNRRRLRCTKCYAILAPFGEFRQARPLRPTLNPLLREPLRPPNNPLLQLPHCLPLVRQQFNYSNESVGVSLGFFLYKYMCGRFF